MIEVRSTARLVLFDADGRVLLLKHTDGHGLEFWATPGGGVEPGETLEQAARREASEELGAEGIGLVPLWTGHRDFVFAGRQVSQDEAFFLVTGHSGVPGPGVAEVHRLEGITAVRWWSVDEIESAEEPIFPPDLVERIMGLVRSADR